MKTFWTPYISDHAINAICWTLIHSLWIGLVIALLTGLVITLTRKSGPGLRYRLLCSLLVLFVLAAGTTFFIEMRPARTVQLPWVVNATAINNIHLIITGPATSPPINLFNRALAFLNKNVNIIFMIWLFFFLLKSLKMAGGLIYIQRLRNYKVHDVADGFKQKVEAF